jgi:peptidoglycan/LPS O-acetylase OafA/YrhL
LGWGFIIVAAVLAGRRMTIRFGVVTLSVGIAMLVFGFVKLAEPSLKFYAPLGFFVSLAGEFLVWGGDHREARASRIAAV